jgi:hypothetical protein
MSRFMNFKLIIAMIGIGFISTANALTPVEPLEDFYHYLDDDSDFLGVLHAAQNDLDPQPAPHPFTSTLSMDDLLGSDE